VLSEACQVPKSKLIEVVMRRFRKELTNQLGVDPRTLSEEELAIQLKPIKNRLLGEDKQLWEEQLPHA
jgi:hypothetical protein